MAEPYFRPGTGRQPPFRPTQFDPAKPAGPDPVSPAATPRGTEAARHSQGYAYDPASGLWLPLRIDPATGRLLVDSNLTVSDIEIGAVEVKNATTDDRLVVNADGTASVRIVPLGSGHVVYGEVNAVAAGADVSVVAFTVAPAAAFHLRHVSVSGDNVAKFTVTLNGTPIGRKLTYFTHFNEDFFFAADETDGKRLVGGDELKVLVRHARPYVGDFNASVLGRLA